METFSPTQNLIRNMENLMRWRGLSQQAVAESMDTLGFSWYRKTVHRVIGGERPVRVDELFGLALVLETTVGGLLAPDATSDAPVIEMPTEDYKIGSMPEISPKRFRKLLDVPDDRLDRSEAGVLSWAPSFFVNGLPQWKVWPKGSIMTRFNDALAKSGWKHADEFFDAHPEAEKVPWRDLNTYAEKHPNPRREAPMD